MIPLDQHLGEIYRERVIFGVDRGAQLRLDRAIAVDPEQRARAEVRLAELRQIPVERCFISAQHRRFLEGALARTHSEE